MAAFQRNPLATVAALRRMPDDEVEARFNAMLRHQADVLFNVRDSRAGTNFLLSVKLCHEAIIHQMQRKLPSPAGQQREQHERYRVAT